MRNSNKTESTLGSPAHGAPSTGSPKGLGSNASPPAPAPVSFRRLLPAKPTLGLLALGAIVALLSACSARLDSRLDAAGGADVSAKVSMPESLAAKLRAMAGMPASVPLFDASAARKALEARPGVSAVKASCPDPDSLDLAVSVTDLAAALAAPDIAGLVERDATGGTQRLRIRLSREHGKALLALVPGLDPSLVEALSPPALGGDDYSKQDYREALGSIIGTKSLPALDAASVSMTVKVPGDIVSYSGGKAEGSTWSVSVPLLDILVLEKPIELTLSWR
ncbi:MAG TPA: hypothetical protein VMV44_13805 [Rectinemataceae bacterium]|nr:hypothetical protein [Rectinemataceae bacterium]